MPWPVFWAALGCFVVFTLPFNALYLIAGAFESCSYGEVDGCYGLGSVLVWLPFTAEACGVAIALVCARMHRQHRHAPAIGLGLGVVFYLIVVIGTELLIPG